MYMLLLPKINQQSQVNLVHTSSPVSKSDMAYFKTFRYLAKEFPNLKVLMSKLFLICMLFGSLRE